MRKTWLTGGRLDVGPDGPLGPVVVLLFPVDPVFGGLPTLVAELVAELVAGVDAPTELVEVELAELELADRGADVGRAGGGAFWTAVGARMGAGATGPARAMSMIAGASELAPAGPTAVPTSTPQSSTPQTAAAAELGRHSARQLRRRSLRSDRPTGAPDPT